MPDALSDEMTALFDVSLLGHAIISPAPSFFVRPTIQLQLHHIIFLELKSSAVEGVVSIFHASLRVLWLHTIHKKTSCTQSLSNKEKHTITHLSILQIRWPL